MTSRRTTYRPAPAAVSLSFVLPTRPSRAAAFRAATTSLLHAGFAFGRELPGRVVYTYDRAGEHYVDTPHVPAASLASFEQAQSRLGALAPYYNHCIELSFSAPHGPIELYGRVYDEPGVLVFSLDFAAPAWRRLLGGRAAQSGVTELVDAARIVFTLLPVELLLIGPSELLAQFPARPGARSLCQVPIAMLSRTAYSERVDGDAPLYQEQLSRGSLLVRAWDAGRAAPPTSPPRAYRRG